MSDADTPLAPALLTRRGFLTTSLRAQGALRAAGEFVPTIGLVSTVDYQAAMRAARPACLAGDRSAAVLAIADVLTHEWRAFRNAGARDQAVADAGALLAFVEAHAA